MTIMLQNSKNEQHCRAFKFQAEERVKLTDIYSRMVDVYGRNGVSADSEKLKYPFRESRESLINDPRPGLTNKLITTDLKQKFRERIDRGVTLQRW